MRLVGNAAYTGSDKKYTQNIDWKYEGARSLGKLTSRLESDINI
jgi:hypothetical protein